MSQEQEKQEPLPSIKQLADKIFSDFEEATQRAVNEFDPTAMLNTITDDLNVHKQQTIMRVLGMECYDDGWRVASGKSVISEQIEAAIGPQLKEFVLITAKEVAADLVKQQHHWFKDELRKHVGNRLKNNMSGLAREMANDVCTSIAQESYDKLRAELGLPKKEMPRPRW